MKLRDIITWGILTISGVVSAQNSLVIDDFENGLKDWVPINDASHISFEIMDNPSKSSENTSSKVLKCTRKPGSVSWAGVILRGQLSAKISSDDDGYDYATIKFMKTKRGAVSFKLESGPNDETYESTVNYPSTSDWTTIKFDLRSALSGTYHDFFVMVDRVEETNENIVVYIDDITLHKKEQQQAIEIDPNSQNGTGETNGYHLIWQDLFDEGHLDTNVWNVEVRDDGGGNNELQYYIKDNVSVGNDGQGNGCLIITAKRQRYGSKDFTSGRLTTQGRMRFCHGKLEASIKLPKTANGLWPAFWLLGDDIGRNNWPNCGEIDVLEMGNSDCFSRGTQDRYFNGACHWGPMSNGNHPSHSNFNTWNYSLQDDQFHLYTLYWDKDKIIMYVDQDRYPNSDPYFELNISDKSSQSSAGNYFHHNFFVLFNLAIGGDFSRIYDANGITALANGDAKMYVNYVKVYQKGESGESYNGPIQDFTGMELTSAEDSNVEKAIYNINGVYLAPYSEETFLSLPKGVYIIETAEGFYKKCNK